MNAQTALRSPDDVPVSSRTATVVTLPSTWHGERTHYGRSAKPNPVALIGALGFTAAIVGSLMMGGIVRRHTEAAQLTVIEMHDLAVPPPEAPPPPKQPDRPQTTTQVKSIVTTKSAAVLPAPPPDAILSPAPSLPVPPKAAAPAPTVAAKPSVSDLSLKLISSKAPTYPLESRQLKEQGTVVLSVLVGPDGRVSDVSVSKSSGSFRLDRAARDAVRKWRWAPSIIDGVAVAVKGFLTFPFVLSS